VKHTVVTGFVDEGVTQVAENDMVALKQVISFFHVYVIYEYTNIIMLPV
jgi:hypothetical protein